MCSYLGKSLLIVDYERAQNDAKFMFYPENLKSVLKSVQNLRLGVLIVIGSARLGKSTLCKYSFLSCFKQFNGHILYR